MNKNTLNLLKNGKTLSSYTENTPVARVTLAPWSPYLFVNRALIPGMFEVKSALRITLIK